MSSSYSIHNRFLRLLPHCLCFLKFFETSLLVWIFIKLIKAKFEIILLSRIFYFIYGLWIHQVSFLMYRKFIIDKRQRIYCLILDAYTLTYIFNWFIFNAMVRWHWFHLFLSESLNKEHISAVIILDLSNWPDQTLKFRLRLTSGLIHWISIKLIYFLN